MAVRAEIPTGTMWSGRPIPTHKGVSIFQYFAARLDGDVTEIRDDAMFKFDLTREEFDYWLGEFRFVRR